MKNTKKDLLKFRELKFTIFFINEDGSRGLMYMSTSGLGLIKAIIKYGSHCRFVVVEEEKANPAMRELGYYNEPKDASQTDPKFYEKIKAYAYDMPSVY